MIKAFIDASTKGNPGPSGGGILLVPTDSPQEQYHFSLKDQLTNHEAEFAVFLHLLHLLIEKQQTAETVLVYSDSKVLVSTVDHNTTKNPLFLPWLTAIQALLPHFQLLILQWLPESQNKGADHLARQGLAKALKLQNRRK